MFGGQKCRQQERSPEKARTPAPSVAKPSHLTTGLTHCRLAQSATELTIDPELRCRIRYAVRGSGGHPLLADDPIRIRISAGHRIQLAEGDARQRLRHGEPCRHNVPVGYGVCLEAIALSAQNVAIGFNGNPVPPNTGTGAAVSRNSQRLRRDATCATASRSITSISGSPIATIASW